MQSQGAFQGAPGMNAGPGFEPGYAPGPMMFDPSKYQSPALVAPPAFQPNSNAEAQGNHEQNGQQKDPNSQPAGLDPVQQQQQYYYQQQYQQGTDFNYYYVSS